MSYGDQKYYGFHRIDRPNHRQMQFREIKGNTQWNLSWCLYSILFSAVNFLSFESIGICMQTTRCNFKPSMKLKILAFMLGLSFRFYR